MAHFRSLRLPRVVIYGTAALAVCLLGCSDDNRGPTIGAPQGPGPVIVEGGGSSSLGGAGGNGANRAETAAAGLDQGGAFGVQGGAFNAGGSSFGSGGVGFGAGGTGTAGTGTQPFGTAGVGVPFGTGGMF